MHGGAVPQRNGAAEPLVRRAKPEPEAKRRQSTSCHQYENEAAFEPLCFCRFNGFRSSLAPGIAEKKRKELQESDSGVIVSAARSENICTGQGKGFFMAFFFREAEKLARKTSFPVRVSRLYACDWKHVPVSDRDYIHQQYSVLLRYDSDSRLCMDKINGRAMGIPFPHVVFKIPGMKIRITEDAPRSVIGFSYSAEVIELLRAWDMCPAEPFLPLSVNAELKRLIGDFNKFARIYPTLNAPGDKIDSICFSILREIIHSLRGNPQEDRTPLGRIKEVELYFQHHYDEKLELTAIADQFGFSHTAFYRQWKKIYHTTPHSYIDALKIRSAAARLLQSSRPLAVIAEELHFPGTSYFHRKFREHFHTTPAEFRRNREYWKKVLFPPAGDSEN